MMNKFIAILHFGLQRLVKDEVSPLLCALIDAENMQTLANRMLKDDVPIPSLVASLARKWKVEAPDEVKERQEFKQLSKESAAIIDGCQNDLARIVGRATKLTAGYLQEISVKLYCCFLLFLVNNAMVQLGIKNIQMSWLQLMSSMTELTTSSVQLNYLWIDSLHCSNGIMA